MRRPYEFSWMILLVLLGGLLISAFNIQPAKASGTIYIRADGSVDPDTAPIFSVDNITYTLTDNIVEDVPEWSSAIMVERDNIVVDGAGCTLQGIGGGIGLNITSVDNVTIQNMEIRGGIRGIRLCNSSNSNISGNNITNSHKGIDLLSGSNNSIVGNNITNCGSGGGISLYQSSNNIISGNNIRDSYKGITLLSGSNNSIVGNNITENTWGDGIAFSQSSNNVINGNKITNNSEKGVLLFESSNNTISGNKITNNYEDGVYLYESSNNTISGNKITNNYHNGVVLAGSSNNTISGNNITNNLNGIKLLLSSSNIFYHNNFIDNQFEPVNIQDVVSTNLWDIGYPSGGNYWSDHVCSGNPSNGSQPYIIFTYNIDYYPFQHSSGWLLPQLTVTSSPTTGITFTVNGVPQTTPYTDRFPEGSYILGMPETHNGYVWSHWLEDGDTNRVKTITLPGTVWTAVYLQETKPPVPIGGTTISMESGYLSSWIASILLIGSAVVALSIRLRQNK